MPCQTNKSNSRNIRVSNSIYIAAINKCRLIACFFYARIFVLFCSNWQPEFSEQLLLQNVLNPFNDHEAIMTGKENIQCDIPDVDTLTQTGMITPFQFFSLFSAFQKMPGYKNSNFLEEYKNSLAQYQKKHKRIKMEKKAKLLNKPNPLPQ